MQTDGESPCPLHLGWVPLASCKKKLEGIAATAILADHLLKNAFDLLDFLMMCSHF